LLTPTPPRTILSIKVVHVSEGEHYTKSSNDLKKAFFGRKN